MGAGYNFLLLFIYIILFRFPYTCLRIFRLFSLFYTFFLGPNLEDILRLLHLRYLQFRFHFTSPNLIKYFLPSNLPYLSLLGLALRTKNAGRKRALWLDL